MSPGGRRARPEPAVVPGYAPPCGGVGAAGPAAPDRRTPTEGPALGDGSSLGGLGIPGSSVSVTCGASWTPAQKVTCDPAKDDEDEGKKKRGSASIEVTGTHTESRDIDKLDVGLRALRP